MASAVHRLILELICRGHKPNTKKQLLSRRCEQHSNSHVAHQLTHGCRRLRTRNQAHAGPRQNNHRKRRPPAPPAGPAALLPFRGRCVSTKLGADDLRVCPFANATQTSLAGQEFVLGVFAAWRGRSLVYSDGDVCGAAPRNATVSIRCGAESYGLRDAREPATCTYEATLDVPIDCDVLGFDRVPNDIVQLRADLVKAEAAALAAVNRAGDLAERLERASCAAAAMASSTTLTTPPARAGRATTTTTPTSRPTTPRTCTTTRTRRGSCDFVSDCMSWSNTRGDGVWGRDRRAVPLRQALATVLQHTV